MTSISNLRKYRIFGIAIFDLVTSMIGLVIVFLIFKHFHYPTLNILPFIIAGILLAIPLGIMFHILFGINSTLNYMLGLSNNPKQ